MEGNDLVQTVDEFRRELSPDRSQAATVDFAIQGFVQYAWPRFASGITGVESQRWAHQRAHFGRAQISGHEDHRTREIYSSVIAQRESVLVQYSQQEIPRYPGGEPISLAISWLCWNSAQSILITALELLTNDSAVASTMRFPRARWTKKDKVPNGPAGAFMPVKIHLIDTHNFPNRFLLPDNALAQVCVTL
jgi:hypothetical protein